MRCALIKDGIIENFIEADPALDTVEGYIIVDASDVDYRYVWDGSKFIPGPELQAEMDAIVDNAWGE